MSHWVPWFPKDFQLYFNGDGYQMAQWGKSLSSGGGDALSRNVQCQGVDGFSVMKLELTDGGGESRLALYVLQPCFPGCTSEGREMQK